MNLYINLFFVLVFLFSSIRLYSQEHPEYERKEETETYEFLNRTVLAAEDTNYNISNIHTLKVADTLPLHISNKWSELGPHTNTNSGIGKVSSVAFGSNSEEIYIGAAYGGVWKSIDGGVSFFPFLALNELPILAVTDIEIDLTNNYLYIATGDNYYNALVGSHGIYRCNTDGTNVINLTSHIFPTNFYTIENIFLSDSNTLYAATSQGIFRTDYAISNHPNWTHVYEKYTRNIIKDPSLKNTLYASGSDIIKSSDNGITWESMIGKGTGLDLTSDLFINSLGGSPVGDRRISITQSYISSKSLYAHIDFTNDSKFSWSSTHHWALFKFNSTNNKWETLGEMPKVDNNSRIFPFSEIISSPIDSNLIFIGRQRLSKYNLSTKSFYTNPNYLTINYFHADIHQIRYSPYDPDKLFLCTDGNLNQYSISSNSFIYMPNKGLGNATIYGISYNPADEKMVLIGTQDDGTSKLTNEGNWLNVTSGDGYSNCIQHNPSKKRDILWFRQNDGNIVQRQETSGNWNIIGKENFDNHEPSWYKTKLKIDPIDSSVIYISGRNLWKFSDYGSSLYPTAISKFSYYEDSDFLTDYAIGEWQILNRYAIAPSNNQIIFAAFDADYAKDKNPRLFKSTTGGGTTIENWEEITVPQPTNQLNISEILVSPYDVNTIFISYAGYNPDYRVKKFDGSNWTDYNHSSLIPSDRQINCMIYEPGSVDGIYLGTDIGIFYTNRLMNNWVLINQFPNAIVNELAFAPKERYLYAGTYGRGLWKTSIAPLTSLIISFDNTSMNSSSETIVLEPSVNSITIKINQDKIKAKKLAIYSVKGKKIKKLNPELGEQTIKLAEHKQNTFVIKLKSNKGIIERKILYKS